MLLQIDSNQSLNVKIIPLMNLIPHEQTIESLAEAVTLDLERTGFQRDPIIIDEKSFLVLDGMHRREALCRLGANFAMCVCFDYASDELIIQRWLRYFIAPSRQMLDEVIGLFEFEKVSDYEEAMRRVDSGQSPIALLSKKNSYVSKARYDMQTVYVRLGEFDKLSTDRKIEVAFHPEGEHGSMFSSESVFVLFPTPIRKRDVIEIASSGKVFPYKTTRHIVPIRPMGIYFPLDLLKGNDIGACNRELERLLSESKIETIKPGIWYEGRQYSEPLAIFKRDSNSVRPASLSG